MADTQINLIQRKAGVLSQFAAIEGILRKVAWWYLSVLLVFGIAIGITYVYARSKAEQLEATRTRLIRDINVQGVKEGILLSLKERTGIAAKALSAAKPWGKIFGVLGGIAVEEALTSVSVDESGRLYASMALSSVDEAVSVVTNMTQLAADRSLRSPQMLSFVFQDDGRIQLNVSFIPIF